MRPLRWFLPAALALAGCAAPGPQGPAASAQAAASGLVDPAPPSLGGTRWVGTADAGGENNPPRLEFTREGRVLGFTGCNLLNGSYTVEGDRLDVVAATTKRACLGAGMQSEARLLAVLADKPRITLGARNLVLTGSKGGTFELRQAPAQ